MWGKIAAAANPNVAMSGILGGGDGVEIRGNGKAKFWIKLYYCGGWGYIDNANEMIDEIEKHLPN